MASHKAEASAATQTHVPQPECRDYSHHASISCRFYLLCLLYSPTLHEDVTCLSEGRVASVLSLSRFDPLLSPSLLVLSVTQADLELVGLSDAPVSASCIEATTDTGCHAHTRWLFQTHCKMF